MVKLFRIYLDTCILVSAILESDPAWQQNNKKEAESKDETIQASKTILITNACELKTSTFAIGEFISMGRTEKFGKSQQEMFDLVKNEIHPRCEILNSDLKFEDVPEGRSKVWDFANVEFNAEIKDIKSGESIGSRNFSYSLSKDLCVTKNYDMENFEIAKLNYIKYQAPAFEVMLFAEASKISNECDVHLADALHILFTKGKAETLLTNDKDFYEKWEKNPQLEQKAGMSVKNTVRFVKWLKGKKLL